MIAGIAALFGCGAAPQLGDLPIPGTAIADPPPALRAPLDRDVEEYGRGRFTVRDSRYAYAEGDDRNWQPLLAKLGESDPFSRLERLRPPALPRDWNLALWRGGKADGILIAMPKSDSNGRRLVGYYAIVFTDGFDPPARGNVEG